ncbi:hypothetical protein [Burkholderia sp. SIMBA_051]|uniref:hypothetical protein n=1 Tax=Burkholderia sp. SIMBA_051 TaxID=3085792 RepID=UPI0039787CFF
MTQQPRTVSPLVGEMTPTAGVVLVIGSSRIVSAISSCTATFNAMALLRMMPITACARDIG